MILTEAIDALRTELQQFFCRPTTLVPDLVLIAIARDLLETAQAVQDTANSLLPHKAYANARLAFEACQNLSVLSAHEDYPRAGALAWVYFDSKDAPWRAEMDAPSGVRPSTSQWLQPRVQRMAEIWNASAPGQGALLGEALDSVLRSIKRRPDNFLHENMAKRHHAATVAFCGNGGPLPADTAELNEKLYRALCRETHSRPRMHSFAVEHDREANTIRVEILPRNLEQARLAVLSGTDLFVREGCAALRWQRTRAV